MACSIYDCLRLTLEIRATRPASSPARLTSLLRISLSPSPTTCQISGEQEDELSW